MSTPSPVKTSRAGAWLSRWLFVVLAAVVLIGALLTWSAPQASRAAELADRHAQLTELATQKAALEQEGVAQREEFLLQATGQDMRRQEADDQVATELMRVAATWSDGPEYIEARERVMRISGLTEDSRFMQVFMPGEAQGAFRTDSEGVLHFAYPDVNARLSGFEATLTGVDGDDWSYFALVHTTTTNPIGGTNTVWTAVTYTVDGDGEISEVMAYPGNQPPRESGA